VNRNTKEVGKTGISGQPLNGNGPPRANEQVNKLNKATGAKVWEAVIEQTNIPGRAAAKQAELEATGALRGQGHILPLQKLPK
jgi:hypothetical protein